MRHLLEELRDGLRRPRVLGFTGAPGTGKSTLVDALVGLLRGRDQKVAVVAVDPNSPFSGGAILGDRIRMQRHALDGGVYIRSMGARGHLGGLSAASREAIRLLGAFGFDYVLLETVGVGQSELEVAAVADTTVVVLTPGQGDSVQMLKAGSGIYPALWSAMLAARAEGLEELLEAVERHQQHLETTGEAAERAAERLKDEAADLVGEWARRQARKLLDDDAELSRRLLDDRVPYAAAEEILTTEGESLVPRAARSRHKMKSR